MMPSPDSVIANTLRLRASQLYLRQRTRSDVPVEIRGPVTNTLVLS